MTKFTLVSLTIRRVNDSPRSLVLTVAPSIGTERDNIIDRENY